jgi:hypothetical protein
MRLGLGIGLPYARSVGRPTPGALSGTISGLSQLAASLGFVGAVLGTTALTGSIGQQGALSGSISGSSLLTGTAASAAAYSLGMDMSDFRNTYILMN